jgi:hypothetical protein
VTPPVAVTGRGMATVVADAWAGPGSDDGTEYGGTTWRETGKVDEIRSGSRNICSWETRHEEEWFHGRSDPYLSPP